MLVKEIMSSRVQLLGRAKTRDKRPDAGRKLALTFAAVLVSSPSLAADPTQLPLATLADISNAFQGAFKVAHSDSVSTTSWATGQIAYNPVNESVFIDSHTYQDAIGEFKVPATLSKSTNTDDLPEAATLQNFVEILDLPKTGNTQGINDIGGMAVIGGDLFVQAYKYYDAAASNTHTTMVIRNPESLDTSEVDGYFELNGAAKTVNYISPIPQDWRGLLGGSHLAGNGAGFPINTRLSMGPSLYAFDPANFSGTSGTVPAKKWMSYPYQEALSTALYTYLDDAGPWDSYNQTGMLSNFTESNNLWTEASSAWFGFIIPGTRTFAAIGYSGMHESGGGYKITQWDGNLCGGPCSFDPDDNYPYYWLYDLNDILGASSPTDPMPYEYGKFDNRFPSGFPKAGSFDLASGKLYLLHHAATSSDNNSGHPVISVYQFAPSDAVAPNPPANLSITSN